MGNQKDLSFRNQISQDLNNMKAKTINFKNELSSELKGAYVDSIDRLKNAVKDSKERSNTVYPTIEIDYKEVEENYTKLEKSTVFCLKKGVVLLNIITLGMLKLKW